jgi:hypothetical protein
MVCFAGFLVVFPVGVAKTIWWFVQTAEELRPEIPFWRRTLLGSVLLLSPNFLTPTGEVYRKKLLQGLCWLAIGTGLGLLLLAITNPSDLLQNAT